LLPKLIAQVATGIARIGNLRSIKHQMNDAAGLQLAVKFGLLPLLADIKETYRCIASFRKFYETTIAGLNVSRRWRAKPRRFAKVGSQYHKIPGDTTLSNIPYYSTDIAALGGVNAILMERTIVTVNNGVYYRFESPNMSSWAQRLFQILDSFGVLDPSAAWDLVPFSFVCDWFLAVGDLLHSLKPQLSNITMEGAVGCSSVRWDTDYQWQFMPNSDGAYPYYAHVQINARGGIVAPPHVHVKAYARFPGQPAIDKRNLHTLGKGPFSLNRIHTIANIGTQRYTQRLITLAKNKRRWERGFGVLQVLKH